MRIAFDKMEGAGNDFVIVDHRQRIIPDGRKAEFAVAACHRKYGIGADGLVLVEHANDGDADARFAWDFYNADGTPAGMCGNAARCVALFARRHGVVDADSFNFRSLAGLIGVRLFDGGQVRVAMTDASAPRLFPRLEAAGTVLDAWWMDTGVPHAVVAAAEVDRVDVAKLGKALRHHPVFGEAGANVNFVERLGDHLRIRTYERGVEGETLACGTGAAASAIAIGRAMGLRPPVRVMTRGGFALTIGWNDAPDGAVRDVVLTGPARKVFSGQMEYD